MSNRIASRSGPDSTSGRPFRARSPIALLGLAVVMVGFGVWLVTDRSTTTQTGVAKAVPPVVTVARTIALSPASVCLLTDATGVSPPPGSLVWAGARSAAGAAKARASYLAVPKGVTAATLVQGLIGQHCSVIVGLGKEAITAVEEAAAHRPKDVRFAEAEEGTTATVAGAPMRFGPTEAAARATVAELLTGLSK